MVPRNGTSLPVPRSLRLPLRAQADRRIVDADGTLLFVAETGAATLPPSDLERSATLLLTQGVWGRLFWPARPAPLFAWDADQELVALDGDVRVELRGPALVVDAASGAALTIPAESAAVAVASTAGVDPLELGHGGGASTVRATLVADGIAWLRALGSVAAVAAAAAIERRGGERGALGLAIEQPTPGVAIVRWSHDAPASDAEQDELAKLVASRRSGTHLLLARRGPVPRALERLTGGGVPFAAGGCSAWAPLGRGRVVQPDDGVELSLAPPAIATLERQIDDALGQRAEQQRAAPLELIAAAPTSAQRFAHQVDGGERIVVGDAARTDGPPAPTIGRRVRTREEFTLRAGDWPGGARQQLVLERTTCAEDSGALLRLELDDEDLGPWRLGAAPDSREPRLQLDRFTIPADLVAGREACRIVVNYLTAGEHVALRWRFFAERELAGSWLTDLELTPPPAADDAGVRVDEATRTIGRFLTVRPGAPLQVDVPRGYARFVARLAGGSAEARAAGLAVERLADATTTGAETASALAIDPGEEAISLPLDGTRQRLRLATAAPVTLLDPRILRW